MKTKSNKSEIIPIIVIGAARNGTTQLENKIGSIEGIAHVGHLLHYGSCENNLYFLNKYWKNISDTDKYIEFLFEYSSSDFFKIAEGDIEFHLSHPFENVYHVFFELMDRFAGKNGNHYWVTKLDPAYAADKKELNLFLKNLKSRYNKVKFISIQRNLFRSIISYLKMEGEYYEKRQKMHNQIPAILLYTSRYFNVYHNLKFINDNQFEYINIQFEQFVKNNKNVIDKICQTLEIKEDITKLTTQYQINTSFVKSGKQQRSFVKSIGKLFFNLFTMFPYLSYCFNRQYINFQAKKKPYTYRRLLKYEFFYSDLITELKKTNSTGLLELLENENLSNNT